MKKTILFIFCFALFISNVCASSVEDDLNNLSSTIKTMRSNLDGKDLLEKYPIGSIYISVSSDNPSTIVGGTWTAYGEGRTLIGMGNNGTDNYTTVEQTGGSSSSKLGTANLPKHTHAYTAGGTVSSTFTGQSVTVTYNTKHTHNLKQHKTGQEASHYGTSTADGGFRDRIMISSDPISKVKTNTTSSSGGHSHTVTPTGTVSSTFTGTNKSTSSSGSTTAFNVQNPYITVYIWKRTA